MFILTKKRQARIHEVLEAAFRIPPGDADMEMIAGAWHFDPEAAREFCRRQMVEATTRPRWRWRFWRRRKKCITIPCPSFKEFKLEVEK